MITLSGSSEIVFAPKTCPGHSYSNRHVLDAIVPRGCNFDYGVMGSTQENCVKTKTEREKEEENMSDRCMTGREEI